MPQANSITSSPRWMSPLASAMTLPCSEESKRARSSMLDSIKALKLNITRARRWGVGRRPFREGAARGIHRPLQVRRRAKPHLRLHPAETRVEHLAVSFARSEAASGDEMVDQTHDGPL
jgi:hypothetical protein